VLAILTPIDGSFGQFLEDTDVAPLGLRPWETMAFLHRCRPAGAVPLRHLGLFFYELGFCMELEEKSERL